MLVILKDITFSKRNRKREESDNVTILKEVIQ